MLIGMAVVQTVNQKSTSRVKKKTYVQKQNGEQYHDKINNTKVSVSQVSNVRECKAEWRKM